MAQGKEAQKLIANNKKAYRHLSRQFVDLILMHKQFFGPERILVEDISLFIGAYMHAVHIHLPCLNAAFRK